MSGADTNIEVEELRDAVRGLLSCRRAGESSPTQTWTDMVEAGWLALVVSEQRGGLGQSHAVIAAMLEELGAEPFCNPMHSALVALRVLDLAADGGAARAIPLLSEVLADRSLVVPVGLGTSPCRVVAGRIDGNWTFVPDAAAASQLLVAAEADSETGLYVVATSDGACHVEALESWDTTRESSTVRLHDYDLSRAECLLRGPAVARTLALGRAIWDLALAADSIGGAQRVLALTVDYTKSRIQFGRSIASFQAIKHRCADLATEIAAARALLGRACGSLDRQSSSGPVLAALARVCAGAAYLRSSEEAIQMHGGIGFTWEHSCHRYLKRARCTEVLGGSLAERLDAVSPALRAYLGTEEG